MEGPRTKDQLELYLAGIFCLVETGKPLAPHVPPSNIHRRLGIEVIRALNAVDALKHRLRKDRDPTVWQIMDAVPMTGGRQ